MTALLLGDDRTRESVRALYRRVRASTLELVEPLEPEDQVVQTMPDVSPTKWHLAHTSWFFETFVLEPHLAGYARLDPAYATLFNSYYQSVGPQHDRPARGHLSRPTVAQVLAYRRHVDEAMERFFERASPEVLASVAPVVEVGVNHEEQHQELLVMDVKHVLCTNPLRPAYRAGCAPAVGDPARPEIPLAWRPYAGGRVRIGHEGPGFAFDNERPAHDVLLEPFQLADRLVTCGEWLEFVEDEGYRRPDAWLADGWDTVRREGWQAPLYWFPADGEWHVATLGGPRPIDPHEPVVHVSHYEADAYATWAGARLPREEEWEAVARAGGGEEPPASAELLESGRLHPRALRAAPAADEPPAQLLGDVWEWTASPYVGYPGYRRWDGALGEYNGKFMSGQTVLRGGCCATPRRHLRPTYRNFFYPHQRWAFAGVRLAR